MGCSNVVVFCISSSYNTICLKLHCLKLSFKNVVNGGNKVIHRCRKVFKREGT